MIRWDMTRWDVIRWVRFRVMEDMLGTMPGRKASDTFIWSSETLDSDLLLEKTCERLMNAHQREVASVIVLACERRDACQTHKGSAL